MRLLYACFFILISAAVQAADIRIAVLDFENLSANGEQQEYRFTVPSGNLEKKCTLILSEKISAAASTAVIDRRDFMDKIAASDSGKQASSRAEPSFIHAAQMLRADAVLRGSILSLSSGTRKVNPSKEGKPVNFISFSVRVIVQAIDPVDGTVMASAQGKNVTDIRQTEAEQTVLGEEDLLSMLDNAIVDAVNSMLKQLPEKVSAKAARERVSLSVDTTDNPCMVEIDGILVGTTPVREIQVYRGDHLISVTRPNYTTVTKNLMLESSVSITVPMFRTDLTAEERIEILKGPNMKIFMTGGRPDILIQSLE